jgi:hypothetical protein
MSLTIMNLIHPKTQAALVACTLVTIALCVSSCEDDNSPKRENAPEAITSLTLTFLPSDGGAPVSATATDPDGEGVKGLVAGNPINLKVNATYTLQLQMINGLAPANSDQYNVSQQLEHEAGEHMIFYGWTNDLFSDPQGNGNIDNRSDPVRYGDQDGNQLPLGLLTDWTTSSNGGSGTFRVVLKHQPEIKSPTSSSADGETDLDVAFVINVE